MSEFAVPAPLLPSVAITGSAQRFPVHRIYCVGRNYVEHAKEMGTDPARESPVFFMKPADAVVPSEAVIPYPPGTSNFHHEIELVVAIGRGGRDISPASALEHVYGYATGNDLTRRDLQAAAKREGGPWDISKGFDASAAIAAVRPATAGHVVRRERHGEPCG
jgi:fumarylpyruvate hydrolase